MDETKDVQEPKRSSAMDDTAPRLPVIDLRKQVQPASPFQQRGQIDQNLQDTQAWGSSQQIFPPPPPDTQHDYRLPPLPSPPTDYERRPQQMTPIAYDYERRHSQQVPLQEHQTPLQQYKEYVKFRIDHTSKKASRQRLIHNILQTVILVGAALVSISIGFPHIPSWLPPLIGGIVTIATVIANYYKFGDRSRDLYRSAEDMQREYNWFKSKRGPYKKIDEIESFELLQDRIDTLKREQFIRTFAFEEQKEEPK